MKKGMAVVQLIAAVIILLFSVWATWAFVYGREITKPEVSFKNETETISQETCLYDADCTTNTRGSKCISVYDPNNPGPLSYSCGCIVKDDCITTAYVKRGDACGENSKCT